MRRCLLDHEARLLPSKGGAFEKILKTLTRKQSQNLALTVLYVPYSLDSGLVEGGYNWQTLTVSPSSHHQLGHGVILFARPPNHKRPFVGLSQGTVLGFGDGLGAILRGKVAKR